jgi:hypothetical protein
MIMAFLDRRITIETIPWSEKVNRLADFYIESGLARTRLDTLVESATQFRTAFQKSFKMEDVLLAYERRIKSGPDGISGMRLELSDQSKPSLGLKSWLAKSKNWRFGFKS